MRVSWHWRNYLLIQKHELNELMEFFKHPNNDDPKLVEETELKAFIERTKLASSPKSINWQLSYCDTSQ